MLVGVDGSDGLGRLTILSTLFLILLIEFVLCNDSGWKGMELSHRALRWESFEVVKCTLGRLIFSFYESGSARERYFIAGPMPV